MPTMMTITRKFVIKMKEFVGFKYYFDGWFEQACVTYLKVNLEIGCDALDVHGADQSYSQFSQSSES